MRGFENRIIITTNRQSATHEDITSNPKMRHRYSLLLIRRHGTANISHGCCRNNHHNLFNDYGEVDLPGTDLKSRLQYGVSGSAYYEYEPKRDLLAQVRNRINGGVISQYDYENDAAGRRVAVTRSGSMMSEMRTDSYGYNYRDELISATKNTEDTEYQYSYDDIGNRVSSLDLGTNRTYVANALNQYTSISNLCDLCALCGNSPQYDLDGNQTFRRSGGHNFI